MKVRGHGTSFAKFLEFFLSICCYAIRGKWLKGYWLNIKIFEHRWTRAYDKKLAFSSIRKTRSMKGYRTTTVRQTRNVGTVRNACDPLFSFCGDFNCKNVHNSHKRTVEIVPFTGKADYGKGLKEIFFLFLFRPTSKGLKDDLRYRGCCTCWSKPLTILEITLQDVIFYEIWETTSSIVLLKFSRISMLSAFFASLRTFFSGLIKFDKIAERNFGNFVRHYQCFLNREQRVWLMV